VCARRRQGRFRPDAPAHPSLVPFRLIAAHRDHHQSTSHRHICGLHLGVSIRRWPGWLVGWPVVWLDVMDWARLLLASCLVRMLVRDAVPAPAASIPLSEQAVVLDGRSGPHPVVHHTHPSPRCYLSVWLAKAGVYAGPEKVRLGLVSVDGPPERDGITPFDLMGVFPLVRDIYPPVWAE
jgi:hypothetical protein